MEDLTPDSADSVNGNYGGPCPPVGDKPHQQTFMLFVLAVPNVESAGGIPLTGSAAPHGFIIDKGLGAALLGKASFTARYGR